ncbi:MAG TPA: nuclear transport factor 2 family protein [Trichocoleus sp.]
MTLTTQQLPELQSEPVVQTYFTCFNAGDFAATAALFAPAGELRAPFEDPIVGVEAIEAYLQQEAEGMEASPKEMVSLALEGRKQVVVKGSVRARVFGVNVRWTFLINSNAQIEQAEIKLLASLQELMSVRPGS